MWLTCEVSQAAIFGVDNRRRITAGSQGSQYARATAVAVLSTNVSASGPNSIKLNADSMSEILCPDEKFATDPSLSYACTGFLVAPDLLVTAGHCMVNTGESRAETGAYCEAFSWLFDYHSGVDFQNIPKEKLVGCKEVVYAIREETPPYRDYAVVRLNRALTDRTPFKLSTEPVAIHDSVSMVGYPFGTPAKYASGAHILLNNPNAEAMVANLDAFEGNSGSPVLNRDGEVIGILTGGTPIESLVPDPVHACKRYNRCNDDGTGCTIPDTADELKGVPEFQITGSIVQRIAPVIPWLATVPPPPFIGM